MKKVFFMALAAAAMVGCSNDEVVDINQEAIAFGDNFIENSTRAIDPSYGTEALTQFNVWGSVANADETAYIPVFANDNVEGTVGANVWNCTTKTQYWIAGRKYFFAAVVNGGSNFTLDPDTHLPITVNGFTSNGTTDLLYATAGGSHGIEGKATDNDPVDFTFNHMLAKVQFTVQNTTNLGNSDNSGYYYKVTGVKINNIKTVGDCNLLRDLDDEDKWVNVATPAELVFGNVTDVDDKTNVGDTDAIAIADRATATTHYARMVIPYDYGTTTTDVDTDDLSVSFTLNIYEAGGNTLMATEDVTKTVPVEFVAGNAYNFVIKKSLGEPIQFSVTNAPTWTNGTAPDVEL